MTYFLLMLGALLIELALGWPAWVFARIRHPVVWIGSLITLMDKHLNRPEKTVRSRQLAGALTTLTVVVTSTGIAWIISSWLPDNALGLIIQAVLASSLLASRSLYKHVAAVARSLSKRHVSQAREALSHIVGRDTASLAETEIAAAAIESLAENTSDGVFAPLFWGLCFGLPGMAAYKSINTLDSMIAHRSDNYLAFGFASAKLDDMANIIPSRISAVLIALVGGSIRKLSAIAQDASTHRSPNAGWPESAMAYALDIRLSGPRAYNRIVHHESWINASSTPPDARDVVASLAIYVRAIVLTVCLLGMAILIHAIS